MEGKPPEADGPSAIMQSHSCEGDARFRHISGQVEETLDYERGFFANDDACQLTGPSPNLIRLAT